MQRRVLALSISLLVLLLLASGSTTSAAQPSGGLTIALQVNADGTWQVVELFGQPLRLEPASFNSVARLLGLQFALPSQLLDPGLVAMFRQADVDQLTLALEGEAAQVWLNDLQFPRARIHLAGVQGLLPQPYAEPYGFVTEVLKFLQGTLYVRFAPGELVRPEQSRAAVAVSTAEADVLNSVHLEMTLSPQGRLLSAGGVTRADVDPFLAVAGLTLMDLHPSVAGYLAGFDQVSLGVSSSEMMVMADDQPVVELMWDRDSRLALLEMAQNFVPGFEVDSPQIAPVVGLAESWLESSNIGVTMFIADRPQDGVLAVDINTPITVALNGADAPTVEGLPIYGLDPQLLRTVGYTADVGGLDQVQACWEAGYLRVLVNGQQMPYFTLEDGWLLEAIRLTGFQPHALAGKLEQLLANTRISVTVLADPKAAAPGGDCGIYQAAAAQKPPLSFAVDGTWTRQINELALDKVGLPFGQLGMLPMDIAAQVRLPSIAGAYVPPNLTSLSAVLGPGGFSADVNDVNVAIHWDSTLLRNLANVIDGFGTPYGDLVRQVAQLVGMAEININVNSAETIASGPEARVVPAVPVVAVASLTPVAVTDVQPVTAAVTELAVGQPAAEEQPVFESEEPLAEPAEPTSMLEMTPESVGTVCTVKEGGSLWACWLEFGGSRGTGMRWVEWRDAIMRAYGLEFNNERVIIVQPGDAIAMLPVQ